ncbi:GNAT family N-acetyltransferase [Spirosoma arcticum]
MTNSLKGPVSITIRNETVTDYALTEALVLAAFAPDVRVAELVRKLRTSEALIPELNLVAEVDGVLVGHLMFSRATITSGHAVALLSPLGVLPTYQRRKVGTSLVEHALSWLRKSDFRVVVLEGVPAYYPRFGFTSAHALGIEPPFSLPESVWQAYRLPAFQEAVKGTVIYPEPFDFLHSEDETSI